MRGKPATIVASIALVSALSAMPWLGTRTVLPQAATPSTVAACGPPTVASPVPTAAKTPAVSPAGTTPIPGTDDAIVAAINGSTHAFVDCWNSRDWLGFVALVTPAFLERSYGVVDPAAAAGLLESMTTAGLAPPITLDSALFARQDGPDTASIEVRWRQGFAEHHESWHFVFRKERWLLDTAQPLTISLTGDAVGLGVTVSDSVIVISRDSVAETERIVFEIDNQTAGPVSISLISIPNGIEFETIGAIVIVGGAILAGATIIDQGTITLLHFVGLPVGNYQLVVGIERAFATAPDTVLMAAPVTVFPAPEFAG